MTARQLWPHKKVEVCYEIAEDIGEVADENAALVLTCGERTVVPELTFTSDSSYPWTTDSGTHKGSGPSHKSGGYNVDNAKSTMCCTVSGATQVSFYWKVSSEWNYDKLKFYVDGTEKTTAISGNVDWTLVTVALNSLSSHTLKWSYEKDGSLHSGSDCGWVDCIDVKNANPAVMARTVLGDTRRVPGLHRVVWDMEADGEAVNQTDAKFVVGYCNATKVYDGALPTTKTLLWRDMRVSDIENVIGYFGSRSVIVPSDVIASHFKLNGSMLTVQFQLADDKYTKCVGAEFVEENGNVYGRAVYSRYRDGTNHVGEDFDSGSYHSGSPDQYAVYHLRVFEVADEERGVSGPTAINVSSSVKDDMSVSKTMTLGYSPIDAREVELQVDGTTVLSSEESGEYTWMPRKLGEHTLKHIAGSRTWTRKVNVTELAFAADPSPNPPMPVDANISITPVMRTFEQGGDGGAIITSGSGTWTAAASEPWIVLNATSGNAGFPVAYTVSASTNVGDRVGYVYVGGHVHTVTQHGYESTISPMSAEFETRGGTGTIAIETTNRIAWNAKPNADWISIMPTSGVGPGTVSYAVAPYNEVSTRTGTITVGDQTFTVRQTGRRIKLSTYREVRTDYFSHVIPVTVNALASTHWSVTPNASWISVVDAGNGVGGDSVSLAIADNINGATRYGTVTIGTETLLIVQGEPITITPETATAAVGGANGFIAVGAWPETLWLATVKSNWLSILGNTEQAMGCGNVVYTVSPNPTLYERTGTIEVAEKDGQHGYPVRTHTVTQPAATASLSSGGYEFGADGGSFSVAIDTASIVEWKVEGCPDWLTVPTGLEGVGPQTVRLQAAENNTVYPRTVTLKIAENDFVVTQKGRGVEVEYDSILFETDGGLGSFSIHPDGNVAWNAVSSDPTWITVFQNESGTGDAEISYIVSPYVNNGAARTGYIEVGDKKVYVTQRPYEMNIDPYLATVTGDAGSGQVGISAPIGSVWEAIATEPWITVMTPTGSGSGTVVYQFTENLTGKVRTGKIIISGEEYTVNQTYRVAMSVGVEGRGSVTGAGNYDYGDDVTLTAVPEDGYKFSHWSGAATGTDNPVTIRIDEACKATAHFTPVVPVATATTAEKDGVTISWGALAWADQYRVYRAESTEKPESPVAMVDKGTLTWRDTTATPGKMYYYWVEAVGAQEQVPSEAVTGKRAVSLTGVTISCVSELFAGTSANCACTAAYNDGTSKSVAPNWSVDGAGATIDASGVLTATAVEADMVVTVRASHAEDGITKTASAQVTICPTVALGDVATGVGDVTTGGSGAWFGQTRDSCGGAPALRSPRLAGGSSAWVGCSVTGAGTLTFKWRKEGADAGKLALTVNGSEAAACGDASDTWATVTKEFLDGGAKTLRWTVTGGANADAYGLVAEICWTPGTAIAVDFDANGGSGSMAGMAFLQGADKTLTANAFARTGYAFAGWATSADGDVACADCASVVDMVAPVGGVITLYAKWTANVYSVAFDANGGDGFMEPVDCTYGTAQALPANAFARTGYMFAGWATSADGAVAYADGANVTTLAASGVATLYAKWTPISYSVKFVANGGGGTMPDQEFTYDAPQALAACAFARTGFSFAGWAKTAGGAVAHAGGAVVENLTAEQDGVVTLYAKWTVNEYVVDFNSRGGTGTMSDQPMTYGEEAALYANLFARTGYTFLGWTDDEDELEEVLYCDGVVVSNLTDEADGEFDLYAIWAANEYAVKFNANGGSGTMADQAFVYDAPQALAACAFARTGFTFAGWAKTAGGAVAHAGGAVVENLTAEPDGVVTLYAKWTVNEYVVEFNANGGSCATPSKSYAYGAALGELPTATRSKYKFLGWYTAATGGTKVSASTTVTDDVTYYARWTHDGPPCVDGKVVDGCADMGTVSGGKIAKAGTKVTLKATAKKGFVFAGWYCNAAGDEPVQDAEDHRSTSYSYVAGEDDATFYAKFIPVAADWATVGCEVADEYATKQEIEPITVAADGGSLPTVKVAGLPAGLKFTTKEVLDKNKSVLAAANTIYGTPTKSGVFNAKVTVTTAGKATASTDLVFTVLDRVNDERVLRVECDQSAGKATGAGVYAAGKKVTLKATAAKNHVFAGWYADSDCTTQLVGSVDCRTASFPYAMPDADKTVYARFVPAAEDADVKLFVGGGEVTFDAAGTVFNTAGELTLALDVESASAPKIAVSGLPAGLKFTAKEVLNKDKSVFAEANTIYGTATKPGTYVVTAKLTNTTVKKAVEKKFTVVVDNLTGANDCFREPIANACGEKYDLSVGVTDLSALPSLALANPGAKLSVSGLPSGLKYNAKTGAIEGVATKVGAFTVYLTVTEGKVKAVSTITMDVAALPAWLVGSYEGIGGYSSDGFTDEREDNLFGTLTVSSVGKLSGKFTLDVGLEKKNPVATCSLAALDRKEGAGDDAVYFAAVSLTFKAFGETRTLSREIRLSAREIGDSGCLGGRAKMDYEDVRLDLGQNLYGRKDFVAPAFATTTVEVSKTLEIHGDPECSGTSTLTATIGPKGSVNFAFVDEVCEGDEEWSETVKTKGTLIITGYDADAGVYTAESSFVIDGGTCHVAFSLNTDAQGRIVSEGSEIVDCTDFADWSH